MIGVAPLKQTILTSTHTTSYSIRGLRDFHNLRVHSMMGNEKSQPAGLSIDDIPTEVTENWTLHGATYLNGNDSKISVFLTTGTQTSKVVYLETFTKNIMVYRHPCIVKYVASWKKGLKCYLATERVQPLAQVLPSQTSLQICIGLQNILKALLFLHDSGSVSHNNVCRAAVYVTQGGSWKLGGFEYLCKFNNISSSYLEEIKSYRYGLAIAPDEDAQLPQPLSSIDGYAFGVLAQEVLVNESSDDVPGMLDFLDMCKKWLQNPKPELRPTLSSVLNHPFFAHDFLAIHNFLQELPIKEEKEKQEFFRTLSVKLDSFPEEIVASQLGPLLLSRIVLLDPTAQYFLLPQVFNPRRENSCEAGLFSGSTFTTHMIPRLLPLFCVRDYQIRMILLSHFHSYCSLFSQVQLESRVLPELLVGIKDTNDNLVSSTLKALAELVMILGGATVVGGKRSKLFTDGKPKALKSSTNLVCKKENLKTDLTLFTEVEKNEDLVLPERPSPDGGEFVPAVSSNSEEDEAWPGWDNNTENAHVNEILQKCSAEKNLNCEFKSEMEVQESNLVPTGKVQKLVTDECDNMFHDMEPVISKPQIIHVQEEQTANANKFALVTEIFESTADGWDEDFDEWNDS